LPRELPLLTADDVVGLTGLAALQSCLDAALCGSDAWSPQARAGLLLHSAIIHGGLLNKPLQQAFLRCRREDLSLTPMGTWLALPLETPPRDEPRDGEQTLSARWLVRAETELLLLHFWSADGDRAVAPAGLDAWRALRACYQAAEIPKALRPRSFRQLNRWARAKHAFVVPPFLRETQTGRFPSTALPLAAHRRFCTGERIWTANDRLPPRPGSEPTEALSVEPPTVATPLSAEMRALKRVLSVLGAKGMERAARRHQLQVRQQRETPNLGAVSQWICHWAVHLLASQTKQRRISTIVRYVRPVRRYLPPLFAGTGSQALTSQEWEDRFQEAIDQASDGLAPYAIYLFARFITAQPDGPDFDPDEFEGIDSVHRVDANLVSVADFESAMRLLKADTQRETRMLRLLAVLGFYAGLRRGEALHIRLGDISGRAQPWLFVRRNEHHRLKRTSSQRCLPLGALLPTRWLAELQAWILACEFEGSSTSRERLLFCAPGKDQRPINASESIAAIRDVLRQVTGDQSLVYHHLRHSFANWTLIRLLAPQLPLEAWRERFAALQDAWFEPASCRALREAVLFPRVGDQPVRHAAYALARLMGHAQIGTTLRSYLHLTDLLVLGYQSRGRGIDLPEDAVRWLLGLGDPGSPRKAAYHRWLRRRKAAWSETINGLRPEPILHAMRTGSLGYDNDWPSTPIPADSALIVPQAGPAERELTMADVPAVLGALFQQRLTVTVAAERLQLSPLLVDRLKAKALTLADQRTTASGKRRFVIPPTAPSNRSDGDVLVQVLKQIEDNDVDWAAVRGGIDLLSRADPSRGHRIVLDTDTDALRFLAMLEAIGLKRSTLRIDLYARPDQQADNQRYWTGLLGIPARAVTMKSKNVGPSAEHGAIAIGIRSPRSYSRLHPKRSGSGDYDPQRAKSALATLRVAERAEGDVAWCLASEDALQEVAWLLGWMGVPAQRIERDVGQLRLVVRTEGLLPSPEREWALRRLPDAMPHHDLRWVCRAEEEHEFLALLDLLMACGVDAGGVHLDLTGRWDQQQRQEAKARLLAHVALDEDAGQIELKRRGDRPPSFSLTTGQVRGREPIHAWSLTYTLILLYIYLAALPEAGGPLPRPSCPSP
jgi:integrase